MLRSKLDKSSLEMLITLAARSGCKVEIAFAWCLTGNVNMPARTGPNGIIASNEIGLRLCQRCASRIQGEMIMEMAVAPEHAPTRARAVARVDRSAVDIVNGRLVSLTLHDPKVKKELSTSQAELRKDPVALKARYVKLGFITQTGKLTKRFGG